MVETAVDRLKILQNRIEKATQRAGRKPGQVKLLAVTKTVPLERILPFVKAGVKDCGENRVQEAAAKFSPPPDVWRTIDRPLLHLVGALQSNKAKKAVELFDMVQSLDRWDLAQDLDRHAVALGKTMDCLIQLKISEEPNKSGLDPEQLPEFLQQVKSLSHLRVRGLMGIPPLAAQGNAARPYFRRLRCLFEDSRLEILSMGMSSDFEVAIEEGSTMVRIGAALFGLRNPL